MSDKTTDTRKQWVVRDELGEIQCAIYATTQDEAIDIFCRPALRREAYFGPRDGIFGGWTCEEFVK